MKRLPGNRQQVEYSYIFGTPAFPLAVKLEENAGKTAPHIHENFSELVIILQGKAVHQVAERKYNLTAGDVFVIGKNQTHSYSGTENFCYCNVLMDWDALKLPQNYLATHPGYQTLFVIDRQDTAPDRFHNRFRLNPEQLTECCKMLENIEKQIPGRRFEAIANFMLLVAFLCDCCNNAGKENISSTPFKLGNIVAKMEKHCERNFSISDMCRQSGMSRAAFFRYFTNCYGVSPIKYLLNLRVNKSMQLLRDTKLNCSEIAMECGFTDASYFAMHFKKINGITPTAYRTQYLKKISNAAKASTPESIAEPGA